MCISYLPSGMLSGVCISYLPSGMLSGVCISYLPSGMLSGVCINYLPSGMLSGVCISYDNSLVVATATSGTIFLYDTTSPKPVHSHYDAHQMGVNGCDITLEGERNLLCTVGRWLHFSL